jgi:hypothetical protein
MEGAVDQRERRHAHRLRSLRGVNAASRRRIRGPREAQKGLPRV